jgi:hypothetical protein
MNPLTLVLAMLTATAVTGPLLVPAFALGLYGWSSVVLALSLGAFGAGALARRIEDTIKREDPAWDELRDCPRPVAVLRPNDGRHLARFDPARC